MGKAVPKTVKNRANLLLQERPELFCGDFEKNKRAVDALQLPFTKTIRNLVAGFITREKVNKERKKKPKIRKEKPQFETFERRPRQHRDRF